MRLRKWFELALKMALWSFALGIGGCILYSLNSFTSVPDLVAVLPLYMVLVAFMLQVVVNGTSFVTYIPLSISLNSTRREVMVGMQLQKILMPLIVTGVAALISLLIKTDISRSVLMLIPFYLFVEIAGGSFGGLIGCVKVKYGKLGAVLMCAAFVLLGGVGGFFGFLSAGNAHILTALKPGTALTVISAIVCAVLFAASAVAQYFTLKNYEVKLF